MIIFGESDYPVVLKTLVVFQTSKLFLISKTHRTHTLVNHKDGIHPTPYLGLEMPGNDSLWGGTYNCDLSMRVPPPEIPRPWQSLIICPVTPGSYWVVSLFFCTICGLIPFWKLYYHSICSGLLHCPSQATWIPAELFRRARPSCNFRQQLLIKGHHVALPDCLWWNR